MKFEDGLFVFDNGISVFFWQTLSEVFTMHKFNWSTFQFILVEFENYRAMQTYVFTFALLCCGVQIRVPTHPKVEHKIHKQVRTSVKAIDNICYGFTPVQGFNDFRKGKREVMLVHRTKPTDRGKMKKLLIQ